MRFQFAIGSCFVFVVSSAFAGISQSTLVSPGGFLQTLASPQTPGSSLTAGDDLSVFFQSPGSMVSEGQFAGIGSVYKSASSTGLNLNNHATGTGGMGYLLTSGFNDAPNNSSFPRAATNGGWKDTFTITHPQHNGASGFLIFSVDANGFLEASGFAGSSSIRIAAYKDNVPLQINQYFDPGESDLLSTDRQYGSWSLATYGSPPQDSRVVRDTVTFSVPMTFGTPFTLGVYGCGQVGMRSSSSVPGNSTARIQDGEVRWGGIVNILAGNVSVTGGSTVSSASGMDWRFGVNPPDPCPGDFNFDGVVDDADFVLFVAAYNLLDCADPAMADNCPCDMNADGFVDDADFVEFVFAYNNLTCV